MKDFCKKYKIYIIITGYILLVAAFFYWGVFFLVENIKENSNKIQESMLDSEVRQRKLSKIPTIEKSFGEITENENKLTGILKEEEKVDFIKKLEILAEESQNKIDLKIIDEGQKEDGKKANTKNKNESKIKLPKDNNYISLQADLTGNYSGLINFIKKLENFEYYVNVISISSKLAEDTSVEPSENPFENITSKKPQEEEAKMILKTQINFIAYIKK